MAYRIVFFDVDGTLLDEAGTIPEDTRRAVRKLQDAGVLTVIATGRSPYHLKPVADELGIRSYVSFNGSLVVLEGEVIVRHPIPADNLHRLAALSEQRDLPMVYVGDRGYAVNRKDHPDVAETFRVLHIAEPAYDPGYWSRNDIYQVMMYCLPGREEEYEPLLQDLRLVRWHRLSVDVLPSGYSKASGVRTLLEKLGIAPDEAIAFGDNLNDLEMLACVGMGIAMGNAHEELKAAARRVTRRADDGGISAALRELGLI
jgi:hypothetical protein